MTELNSLIDAVMAGDFDGLQTHYKNGLWYISEREQDESMPRRKWFKDPSLAQARLKLLRAKMEAKK